MAKHFRDLEVIELCGQGGMGVVYKARHTRLDRVVALKVLHQDASRDPAFAERFLREARALARLSHPGIVAVHDFGEVDGLFYLVMEFVDGVDLRRTIRGGELAPRQALTIVRELCEALQYAHDEGVVHRDIKPENVLIDKRGRVKIADFGLAKLAGSMLGGGALTATGQVMGTPHYMAPEQIEHPQDVDHRADIYSLGVVLYEMLTGSLPLGRFEAPSRRVDIDVRLDEIVLRTLEREPARRYQHAVDVKTDVDGVGQGDAKPAAVAPSSDLASAPKAEADSDDPVFVASVVSSIDPSKGLWPIVVFACTWLLTGWLFNFGLTALVAAGVVLISISKWVLMGRIRRNPALASALNAERAVTQWVRWIAASLFLWLGFGLLLAAHVASWEHGTTHYEPSPEALYLSTHDDPDWNTFQQIAYPGTTVQSRFEDARFFALDSEWLVFHVSPIALGALAGFCWLIAALAMSWRRTTTACVRPALETVASAFLGLALVHIVWGFAAGDAPPLEREPENRNWSKPLEQVRDEVAASLRTTGYQVHAEWRGKIVSSVTGQEVVQPQIMLVANGVSPLDRWRVSWHGAERTGPHLLVTLIGRGVGDETATDAYFDSGRAAVGSRWLADWARTQLGLFRTLRR
jgi:predicted Ser/Thr protein kinase